MLTLYQAEWCPFSSAVREVLTELGVDFVARQVEPWPADRAGLRQASGGDQIPTLVAEDGGVHRGTRAIFRYLATFPAGPYAAGHRRRFVEHLPAREADVAGQLIERFPREEAGPEPDAGEELTVKDVPERRRYELLLGDRKVGHAAYRKRNGTIVFTHTEVVPACEGRGYGTVLARAVLDDARAQGLRVRPLCPFIAHVIDQNPEYQKLLEVR
jgi:predicted GNAT family acetyltransferase